MRWDQFLWDENLVPAFGFKLSCWKPLLRGVRDKLDKCKTHFLEIGKYSQSNAGVGTNLSMKIATFVMRSAKNMTPIAEWGLPRKSMCENVRVLVKFLEKETFLKTSISTCQIFLAVIFRKKSWTERAFLSPMIHEYKDTKISHVFTTLWIDKYWKLDVYLSLIDLFLLGRDSTEFCQNLTGSTAKVLRIELVENSRYCLGYSKLCFICHNKKQTEESFWNSDQFVGFSRAIICDQNQFGSILTWQK